jgi:hypothetical protein
VEIRSYWDDTSSFLRGLGAGFLPDDSSASILK